MWIRLELVVLLSLLCKGGNSWVVVRPSCPWISAIPRQETTLLGASTTAADNDSRTPLPPMEVSSRVFGNDSRPVILFDGVCNMCNNAVNLALDWDPHGRLRFSALQSQVGQSLLQNNGIDANDISSIVLVTKDGAHVKSDAILRITESLAPRFLPTRPAAALGRLLIPRLLRDLIYDGVANNRYKFMGQRDECRLDSDGDFADRFVDESLAL